MAKTASHRAKCHLEAKESDSSPPSPPPRTKPVSKKKAAGPSSSQPPTGPIPSDDAPLLYPRFISLKAQDVYHKVLKKETLMPSMIFDYPSLRMADYDLEVVFREHGLADLLSYTDVIYEDLVREFYDNLEVVKKSVEEGIVLRTRVCGKLIMVSERRLCEWFHIPPGGVRPTGKGQDIERGDEESDSEATDDDTTHGEKYTLAKGKALLHDSAVVEVGEFVKMEATDLPGNLRMLHYAINRSIVPKKDTQNYMNKTDVEILWYVLKDIKINYAHLILR